MWNPKSSSFLHGNIPLKLLKTGGRGGLNKFLHREALPQGLTPCLFIHYLYSGRSRGEDRGAGDWAGPLSQGLDAPPLSPPRLSQGLDRHCFNRKGNLRLS